MKATRYKLRLSLAMTLLAAGIVGLVGCIYIPHLGQSHLENGGLAPEELIGTPKQHRPLTLGQSTADDVARVIPGPGDTWPHLIWSQDRRYAICSYGVVSGHWVYPLCFFASSPSTSEHVLRLTFSPDGRLEGYDVFDDVPSATRGTSFENQSPPVR